MYHQLTEWFHPTSRRMREGRTSCDKYSSHEWVLMIVAVYASRVVYIAILEAFYDVVFVFGNDTPAGLGDDP